MASVADRYFRSQTFVLLIDIEVQSVDLQSQPREDDRLPIQVPGRLRLSVWLWRPWYAKLWWAAIPIYWLGRWASLKVPALGVFYETLPANYLALFCNPFILLLCLGVGFVRAKMDRGEWVVTFYRSVPPKPGAQILDPYTDPTDPRSGALHLRYIGVYDD